MCGGVRDWFFFSQSRFWTFLAALMVLGTGKKHQSYLPEYGMVFTLEDAAIYAQLFTKMDSLYSLLLGMELRRAGLGMLSVSCS